MIPFAVKLKDDPVERGRWVLAVRGDRFLVVAEDGSFEWVAMADCEFLKAATPDQPQAVVVIPARPRLDLVTPLNGGERRV